MRRAFFFIGALLFATTSLASIPRASALDGVPPIDEPLSETRIRVSDVLAPFERPAETELTRALRQGYEHSSTTDASGLRWFLSVDPGKDWDRKQPQSWNMYAYVRNNPIRNVDPDGRAVTISTSGNSQAVQDMIVETLTRPDGRTAFVTIANDQNFTMNMKDVKITPQAVINFQLKTTGSANVTFGSAKPTFTVAGGKTQVTGANVQVDTARIGTMHPDRSGVTTVVHEMHHVNAMRTGGNPGAGDLPSSQTGPAEKEGRRVAAQPPDMTRQQALQVFQNLLSSGAIRMVP